MKKIILFLLLLIPFFIKAEEVCDDNGIVIISASKENSTGDVSEKTPVSFDGKNVNVDLEMENVGDGITYNIVVKNNTNLPYELNDFETIINSNYFEYKYEYNGESILEPNEERTLVLNIKYTEPVPRNMFTNGSYDEEKVNILNLSGEVTEEPNNDLEEPTTDNEEEMINPKTGHDNIAILLAIILVVTSIVMIIIFRSKYGIAFMIIAAVLLIPNTQSICRSSINLNTNIKVTKMPEKICTYDGDLVQGAEFIDGHFIYRYKQDNSWIYEGGWNNIEEDGWGVVFNPIFSSNYDYNLSLSEKEQPCTTINGKYIVSTRSMFSEQNLDNIDFSTLDTSHVVNMDGMFSYAYSNSPINLSILDTSKVTNMYRMFAGANIKDFDVSGLDTSSATTIAYMFSGINVTNLDVSNFDLSNTEYINGVFEEIEIDTLDLSSWDVSHVINGSTVFEHAKINKLILGDWNSSNMNTFNSMFSLAQINNLSIDRMDASNVTNMGYMFNGFKTNNLNLNVLKNVNKVENANLMFYSAEINDLTLDGLNFSALTSVSSMFSNSKINKLTLSNSEFSSIVSLSNWFRDANINTLTTSNVNISHVTNMDYMFYGSEISTLDISGLNTTSIGSLVSMFQESKISDLDLRSLNVSSSAYVNNMFKNCTATVGYAKDQATVDKFNNQSVTKRPDTLVFGLYPIE